MKKKAVKKILEKTRKDYNFLAYQWDRTRGRMWPEVKAVISSIGPRTAVLDGGCGNGRLYPYIKEQKADYLGFDVSEKLVEICKKKYGEEYFFVGDILNLEKIKFEIKKRGFEKFDWVFMLALLHHIPSWKLRLKALENFKFLMNSEGRLVLTVWNIWQKKYLKYILKAFLLKLGGLSKLDWGDCYIPFKTKGKKVNRYIHRFCRKELVELVKKAGLEIEKFEKTKGNYLIVAKKKA